ncbi:TadE family protein [Saccharibacillus alkalitolerans]|uniref:TadE family protein n=1 Tax=Saccharibacillus alkalitolerans TaxID=2705290 RepID=UPI002E2B3492|nr:TadE family protein [Saccharibacillus alkalitolerans]
MKTFRRKILRPLLCGSQGSFTIESTLVMPIVFICVILILMLCLYLYQSAMLVQASAITSERAAYSWNNRHKEARTGSFDKGQTEDLYWRLTEDQLLTALFSGIGGGAAEETIRVPGGGGESLGSAKMAKAAEELPAGMDGTMTSRRGLLHPITTVLHTPLNLAPIRRVAGDEMGGSQYSTVVEPVEFIRNIELVRYYAGKFKADQAVPNAQKGGAAVAMTPENAGVQLSKKAKK